MTLKKHDKYIYWVLFALYVGFHLFLIARHESWRDESQAWTIAKNSTLPGLFGVLCTEGHPALWFLFLRIFAKPGLPFYLIDYISLGIMTVAVFLLLFKSPFAMPFKLCILCSTLFLYYNPVVARIYSLIVLIVSLLAVFWKKRKEKPILYGFLVLLLFQSHILMAGLAGGILLCMGIDFLKKDGRKPKNFIGILIGFSGAILTFLELYQRKGAPTTLDVSGGTIGSFLQLAYLRYGYVRYVPEFLKLLYPYLNYISAKWLILPVLALGVVFLIVIFRHKSYYPAITMLCGGGFVMFVILVIYPGNYQTYLCALYAILFACWIGCHDGEKAFPRYFYGVLAAVLCLMTLPQLDIVKKDIEKPYSGALETAEFISSEIPENSTVFVCYDSLVSPVVAYTSDFRPDVRFYNVDTAGDYTFYVWGEEHEKKTSEELLSVAEGFEEDVYLLIGEYELPDNEYEMVFASAGSVIGEDFEVYKIK